MNAIPNGTDDAASGLAVGMGLVFIIVFAVIGLVLYILPGIIASMRRHPQALPIWLVTIFLGGTGIGWIAALIWAFVTPERTPMAMPMAMPPLPPLPYPPGPAAPTPPSAGSAMADEIAALARLRDQGVLTEAEFTARKHLLLGEPAPSAPPEPAPAVVPEAPAAPPASPPADAL